MINKVLNVKEFETNPDWEDCQLACLVKYKGNFYKTGGYDGINNYPDLWVSHKGKYWKKVFIDVLNWDIRKTVIKDDKLWFIDAGGGEVNYSDFTTAGWTNTTTIPYGNNIELIDDVFYCFGGYDGAYNNSIYSSDDGATWGILSSSPGYTGRAYQKIFPLTDYVYMWGGQDGSGLLSDVWRAKRTNLAKWEQVTDEISLDLSSRKAITFVKNGVAWIMLGKNKDEDTANFKVYTTTNFLDFKEQYIDKNISLESANALIDGNKVYLAGGIFQGVFVDENDYAFYDELDQVLIGESYVNDIIKINTIDLEIQRPETATYKTVTGDRWDSLAVKYYGDISYVNLIFESNPHVKKEQIKNVFCEPGIYLNFPAITSENDVADSQKTDEPVAWWKA